MINVQVLIAKSENEDLTQRPSIAAALDYLTLEPIVVTSCDVARNRSMLAHLALKTDADIFISIDPDVQFEEWQMAAVVKKARETKGVVGGLYSHKRTIHTKGVVGGLYPHKKTTYNFAPSGAHTLPAGKSRAEVFHIGPRSSQDATLVDAVGTGFLAAHRSVYEKIAIALPELSIVNHASSVHWYYPRMVPAEGGNHCLSTDYSFCSYARDAGCSVEILPNVVLGHRGQPWWEPLGHEPECGYGTIKVTSHGFCRTNRPERIAAE